MNAPRSPFTHDFLLVFAPALVWAVHFVAIYGFVGWACARPGPAGPQAAVLTWVVALAGALAVLVVLACLRARPRAQEAANRAFARWMAQGMGALAVVAIVWETAAVFLIPSCPAAT